MLAKTNNPISGADTGPLAPGTSPLTGSVACDRRLRCRSLKAVVRGEGVFVCWTIESTHLSF